MNLVRRLLFGRLEHRCACHHRRGAHEYATGLCTLAGCHCERFEFSPPLTWEEHARLLGGEGER
jgi:hypothetical protein